MKEEFLEIEAEITQIKKENLLKKNEIEEMSIDHERKIDTLLNDVISVVDAYEKAETKVSELGLSDDDKSQKVIKRMLQPKKVLMSILSKYDVAPIDILGKPLIEDLCTVVETEPDNEKENDTVISIEKKGYMRRDRLIRRVEVIVVRN